MNAYIIAAMAALGIGGGLLGLAWGYRESLRDLAFRRRYYGQILCDGRWIEISSPVDPDYSSGDYIKIAGSSDMDGVYQWRWSEWT